ncbi:MAG TPA: hypothetical protein DCS97_08845 [Planctomycetes bacterium]|nr:hypothetical protein [Planctomycetota bacterium]
MRRILPVLVLAASLAAADNLVINGDFASTEKATSGAFYGWNEGDPAHITLASEKNQTFARNADGVHINTYQDIAIRPEWKALNVSAKIRVKGLERTGSEIWMVPCLQFLARNASGEVVGEPKWTKFMITADQDWTTHTAVKTISADMTTVRISIETFAAKGVFDFDDITVTPVLK